MKVAIIGAGAAGLFCAAELLKRGHEVYVFDGNEKAGKKLYITGKGRCNFTNLCQNEEFLENVIRGKKFLYSAIYGFNCFDTVSFFEENGLKTNVERGNRVFPASNKASDVTKTLLNLCTKAKFFYNEKVVKILKTEDFTVETSKAKYNFDRVIVATGGRSYSQTGSSGDGYTFAESFGHNIIKLRPALVPIKLNDSFIKDVQGLSLKNVKLICDAGGKKIEKFGEMLFTHDGISGPIVLTMSSLINRENSIKLSIDFKPALREDKLDERLLRELNDSKNKDIKNVLKTLVPIKLIKEFLTRAGLNENRKVNSITQKERKKLVELLKDFKLSYKGLYDIEYGVVTSGGVDTNEVNPKTMESKIIKGLYFIGEVLDVDALTGGFNLQIAFSTAMQCAKNI